MTIYIIYLNNGSMVKDLFLKDEGRLKGSNFTFTQLVGLGVG
jgi:hypothetical protein